LHPPAANGHPGQRGLAVNNSAPVLSNLPLLALLPADVKDLIVDSFERVTYPFGAEIVREGDEADAFFVLSSGRARVVKRGETGDELFLNVLRPGDSFGEMGLLRQTTRMATIRASSDVEVYRLDRALLQALMNKHPAIRETLEMQVKHRDLSNFFRVHSAFRGLPVEAIGFLLGKLERITFPPGSVIIRQGEDVGPLYIVEEGRLRVYTESEGQRTYRSYLRKGDYFGEISPYRQVERTASVESVSPCKLLKLDQDVFRQLIHDYPAVKKQIEDRIAQYEYKRTARVPLDFAQELLPADAAAHEKVGLDQLDREPRGARVDAKAPAASEGRKWHPSKRIPFVQQIDEMDCGAASLAMICRAYGRAVSLSRIRQLVHTSLDGTSLRALCTAAAELGLAARAVKSAPGELDQLPLPAIVHWQGNHWVVLHGVSATQVRITDPAAGQVRLGRSEFEKKWTGFAALFDYTQEFDKAPVAKRTVGWLWPLLKPFAGLLTQAVVLALIVSALEMVVPIFTQVIVDQVLLEKDVGLLGMLVGAMGAILVIMTLTMVVQRYLVSFAAVRIDAQALDFLVRKMLALPVSYFLSRRTGDIQRRLEGARRVREFVVQNGVRAVTAAMEILAAIVLMSFYSSFLTLVFLLTAPLYALLMIFSQRWLRPVFNRLEDAFGKYHSQQIDAIKGIETVKALGSEGAFREMLLREFLSIANQEFRADFTVMSYQALVQAVSFLSMILFLWFGALEVMQGHMTIGALVAFNALVALANGAIGLLLPLWDSVQVASVLLNRLEDVYEQEPEQGADHSRLLPVRTLEGTVRVRNLSFRYGGPESPKILDGISFEVPAGRMMAIVGRSGCGKTTLVKCLAGLLEPSEGDIAYDGLDMKTLNYRQLRRQVGIVLQENHLFSDTIARNIAFGDDEPDMDQVVWAARAANAHEFIDQLPLGYETKIGESGLGLSGGQRQRIAIARALYRRPPVLIFDEATSALDAESERAIKETMDQMLSGRTAFVIAHRLSTIRDADHIIVLEKGKLVEAGSHDELMGRQGLYFYLCSQQLGL
jgi:HlyB family type I secretion system ABC transporter